MSWRLELVAVVGILLSCGPKPDESITRQLEDRVRRLFKDPESVHFRDAHLFRSTVLHGGSSRVISYSLCGETNAKNSFGAYTGYRRFLVTSLVRKDNGALGSEPYAQLIYIDDDSLSSEASLPSKAFDDTYSKFCVDENRRE